MSQTGRLDYLVMRASDDQELALPPVDSTALLAHVLSRFGRAFSGIDHLFDEGSRRHEVARATFEEQMCKLAAELAREARQVDDALPTTQQRFADNDVWTKIGRAALDEQFVEATLIGPILNEAIGRFVWFATHKRLEMESGAAAYRDELVSFAVLVIDAVTRIDPPHGAE